MMYAGIDPGQQGGLALLASANGITSITQCWKMPESYRELRSIFHYMKSNNVVAIIEKSQPMPKQGVTSSFNYGMGYGVMLGLMIAMEIPYHEIRPVIWKKEILAGEPDKKSKDVSIMVCERLFPEANLMATQRSKKPSDGIAEACLIAEFGRRKNL